MPEVWTMEVPKVPGHYWYKAEPELQPSVVRVDGNELRFAGVSHVFGTDRFHFQQWGPMVPHAETLVGQTTLARKSLIASMENYSEEYYSAGWHTGLEFSLWDRIHGPVDKDNLTNRDCDEFVIASMSSLTNGWAIWDEELGDPKWIPLAEWEQILESRKVPT